MSLDDFPTGCLPGSDHFRQLGGAHTPEVCDCCGAHVHLAPYRRRRDRLTAFTVAAAPSPAAAPRAHILGFTGAVLFSADSRIPSKCSPVVAPAASRLNTMRAVPRPYWETSIRKMYGSSGSSGCNRRPRYSAGIGLRVRTVSWPRRTVTSAPAPSMDHAIMSVRWTRGRYQPQMSPHLSGRWGHRYGYPDPARR